MHTLRYMWFKSALGCLGIVLLAVGCSASTEGDDAAASDEQAATAATIDFALTIAESKEVFSSHVLSFAVRGAGGMDLPCRDRSFFLTSKPSLYAGWSPADAASFSEDASGADFREYIFASCRDAGTQALAWFGKEREYELTVSEQLLDKDYQPSKLPLLVQLQKLGTNASTYYSCASDFEKTLVAESPTAKKFDIALSCKKVNAPSKGQLGPIDFISSPGPYSTIASYREWMLPAVASSPENLAKVRDDLFAKVGEGTYSGAMSTLSKKCEIKIAKTADGLVVDHTIVSSHRTRHLELKASDLLGVTEGDVYADPIRITGTPQGKFVAAEFRDEKGESLTIRFEKNDALDGQIVRINGSEAYCRRLEKK